ncbi:glycosyltransferase family 2 protein [Peptoclostridium acidaminophilum]|uniref:glycosyltransferase family 2 protein n=1 Tax=Peptoclostridium acidaminophilum TaxID=1731 RepID=UPI0009FEB339|nr:glycosyltransferase [Peptoclostridium acidaminophilum]
MKLVGGAVALESIIKTISGSIDSIRGLYIPVRIKFFIGHGVASLWVVLSVLISLPWLTDLSQHVTLPAALLIISGIAYVPGYLNAMLVTSLLMDRQPKFKVDSPGNEVTVLIAAWNEEAVIESTLTYIKNQDYEGNIKIIVIDNNSTDNTFEKAFETGKELDLDLSVIKESNPGKFNALNAGLRQVTTDLVLTIDADTLLHKSALRHIVARIESTPSDVCAVAGSVLVKNSRENLLSRIQEWDYFLGIASIKRYQGLYQGTLVAQGAFSLYKTDALKLVGGWPDAIGEDIVLTWNFLKNNKKVYFEPLAVAFTEVPSKLKHFARQRSRWARGMIEALKIVKPWQQPQAYTKYLTGVNLVMPYLDFVYTFCWIPGLILCLFGHFYIVGPMTLFVLPLTFISYCILYIYQKNIFKNLNLKVRKNAAGFILFVLMYQIIMSPVSVWGYFQEAFSLKRKWK